ncbi:MAG TPA: hypothetical protein DCQ50_21100 [Chryseobacterium sp.]|nr:hypothetical protein [Chryseobacterium sp.]
MKRIIITFIIAIFLLPSICNKVHAQEFGAEIDIDQNGNTWVFENGDWQCIDCETITGDGTPVNTQGNDEVCQSCGGASAWVNDRDPDDPLDPNYDTWGTPEDWGIDPIDPYDDPSDDQGTGPTFNFGPKCHITVDTSSRRYYDGGKISFVIQPGKIARFKVVDENGVLVSSDYKWEINGSPSCSFQDTCFCTLNNPGSYRVRVIDKNTNNRLLQITVLVYNKPTVSFHKKSGYKSEYGFDEIGYRQTLLTPDYEKLNIGGVPYNVAWMSLLDSQTATIKITPVLTSSVASDPNFRVTFKGTTSNIKINGLDSIQKDFAGLSSLDTITVHAEQFGLLSTHLQEAIVVINNAGDTIGKLNIACYSPNTKKLVVVFVNTGSGYRTDITTANILDRLNRHSHNQVHRNWQIVTHNSVGTYPTTLDLTGISHLSDSILTSTSAINFFVNQYQRLNYTDSATRINFNTINPTPTMVDSSSITKTRFLFVSDIEITEDDGSGNIGYIAGRCRSFGDCYVLITRQGNYLTITHEFGHALNLNHTFDSYPGITKFSSTNFMDYFDVTDQRNMFYLYQWFRVY